MKINKMLDRFDEIFIRLNEKRKKQLFFVLITMLTGFMLYNGSKFCFNDEYLFVAMVLWVMLVFALYQLFID